MPKVPRPKVLVGLTVKKATGCGNMYIQLNWYRGRLFEVFATLGHSGGCAMSYSEALTRSITVGLRQESPVPLDDYIEQLRSIRCTNPIAFPADEAAMSCADALSGVLAQYGRLSADQIIELLDGAPNGAMTEEEQVNEEINRLKAEREAQGL